MKRWKTGIAGLLVGVLMLQGCSGGRSAVPTSGNTATPAAETAAATTPGEANEMRTLKLDPSTVHQTIEGFGTTGCWWAKDVGGWSADSVDSIVNLLFSKNQGIGLTIYRFEMGGGDVNNSADPWRRAETFETAPGQYDWSRDANAVSVLHKAVAAGVDDVIFFANTPPGRLTISGKTTGNDDGSSNLKKGSEAEFARYLVDIAQHFERQGIPVKYISPINEPQWSWQESNGQEGCHYEPEQIVTVARALTEELARRHSAIKPSLIDSGKWMDEKYTVQLYRTLAEDPIVGPAIDHFAVHSYWSSDDDKRMAWSLMKSEGVKLPVWQTEWCQMESGRDLGMDAALVLAQTVQEDMTITDCPAWISWLAVSCYDYKDGLVYVDLSSRAVLESKRLWALGNFSRFVLPGYRRVDLLASSDALSSSAYLSSDGKTAVVVAINLNDSAMESTITAEGFTQYAAYETSADHSLDEVAKGDVGSYRFPPKSVTTLVLTK